MGATNLKATMVAVAFVIFLMSCSAASALSIFSSTGQHNMDRRTAIATSISMPFLIASADSASAVSSDSSSTPQSTPVATENITGLPIIANPNPRGITSILINSPKQSAGLELYETKIGTPRRTVVAVRSVRAGGEGAKVGAQRGMILLDYTNIEDVLKRISNNGPSSSSYPIEIRLYNLALGGDAVGDLGRGIVSPDDALELAESVSSNGSSGQVVAGSTQTNQGFMINIIRNARGECGMKSRRGDTMQIRYTARVGDRNGIVYDSSDYRGTGQPYAYILGNNDVIKGVDLGTYDMCPGEIRELTIPPEVGYPNGSKLFKQIPPRSQLFWSVELVELNSVTEENNGRPRAERY